ncbi:MAG TPA: HAD-IA family hydrolase [Lysobacter sp.]|nr:HAD-IA family hydrolase [Lysobacter sp.]
MTGTPPPRYRLIAFDLDGTLVDSFPFFLANMDDLARTHGFRAFASADIERLRHLGSRELLRHARLPWWKLPRVARDFRTRMASATGIPLFDGMADALAALHAEGATLALVTSNSEASARAHLGERIFRLFHHVECGIGLFGKASRLRRLACRADARGAALYVGDELRDADAAQAAGFAFGAVAWGYTHRAALEATRPAWLFERPRELTRLARP